MKRWTPSQTSATGAKLMSKPSPLSPCDIDLISLCTALGPCGPACRAPARQGTPVSTKQTVPPSWLVDTRSGWAITPRTDWINCRMAAASCAFRLIGTTIKPPNWRWFQSSSTAEMSDPLKPTIITAPISWRRVNPAGPRIGSWSTGGDALATTAALTVGFGVGDGELAAARGPQPMRTIAARPTSRRMAGGSLLWDVGKIRRRLLTASIIGGFSCLAPAIPVFGAGGDAPPQPGPTNNHGSTPAGPQPCPPQAHLPPGPPPRAPPRPTDRQP